MPISKGQPSSPAKRNTSAKSSVSRETPTSGLTPRDEHRKESVDGIFATVSMLAIMRGQYADAGAVGLHGPKLSREIVLLGKTHDQIGKALDYLGTAGPYMGLFGAALPLVIQLAINHDRIDGEKVSGIPGVMSKDALVTKVRGELAEAELRERQAMEKAQKDLAALADSMRDEAESHDQN